RGDALGFSTAVLDDDEGRSRENPKPVDPSPNQDGRSDPSVEVCNKASLESAPHGHRLSEVLRWNHEEPRGGAIQLPAERPALGCCGLVAGRFPLLGSIARRFPVQENLESLIADQARTRGLS